jgi:hypothetical protein
VEKVDEEVLVLDEQRLVRAQLLADLRDDLFGRPRRVDEPRRIAGCEAKYEEREGRRAPNDEQHLRGPAEDPDRHLAKRMTECRSP